MNKFLVLTTSVLFCCIIRSSTAADIYGRSICVPGKITGQPCQTTEEILAKYQPLIDNTKEALRIKTQEYSDRINSLRTLLMKHDADTKGDIRAKITNFRKVISRAKQETITSPLAIQTCIRKQEVELNKVQTKSFQRCNLSSNLTLLNEMKNRMMKLEQVISGSMLHCKLLNPLQTQSYLLSQCLQSKVKDIGKQVQLADRQFEDICTKIIQNSLECNMGTSDFVFDNIRYIFGALKDCRFTRD